MCFGVLMLQVKGLMYASSVSGAPLRMEQRLAEQVRGGDIIVCSAAPLSWAGSIVSSMLLGCVHSLKATCP